VSKNLRERNEIKSIRQFALNVDYHPQNLNDIIKGNRDVTVDLIRNAAETYRFNPQYIFTGIRQYVFG
jgi:plasmid maintenance system antidote protein VapI